MHDRGLIRWCASERRAARGWRANAMALVAAIAASACSRGLVLKDPPPPTVTVVDLTPRIDAANGERPADRAFRFEHDIQTFTTAAGLRVALVRDTRTSLVTVDVRYDVGAAADPRGLAGLAHLVEHAMFALRAAPGGPTLGDRLQQVALATNASTTWDATHYTTTADAAQLDAVLALEGERMRAACDQLDDAVLARERDVVLAEEAERSSPAADLALQLATVVYGADHPYARKVGSREVAAATRADVCAFMTAHHAPSRAYLVVSGALDVDATRAAIERSFLAAQGRALAAPATIAAPVLAGQTSRTRAPVAHPTAVVVFPYPRWGAPGAVPAAIGARILREELARADARQDWILDTGVTVLGGPRAPVLAASLSVEDAASLPAAADEIFSHAANVRTYADYDAMPALSAVVLQQMARWDDLLGRGAWIADYLQYAGHDRFMLEELAAAREGWGRYRQQVADDLVVARARVVLLEPGAASRGRARVADARAAGTHELTPWRPEIDGAEADRPIVRAARPPALAIEHHRLANGLAVELAPDPASPLVDVRLVFPVGTAHQPADQPVVASAAAYLLAPPDEEPAGPAVRSTVGDAFVGDVTVDEVSTTFGVRGVAEASERFVPAIAKLAVRGSYDEARLRGLRRWLRERDRDNDEDDDREAAQERRFRARLFGYDHPYANVSELHEPALRRLAVDVLDRWKATRYRARGATLVVSGRFDVAAMRAVIEAELGGWSADLPPPLPAVPEARLPAGASWLAVEVPDRVQVGVRLAFAAASDRVRDRAARALLAEMLLDEVRDVREGLGASYGIRARYFGGAAGSALLLSGEVTDARLAAALPRLVAAAERLRDDEPVRRAAFVRARRRLLALAEARVAGASTIARLLARAARGDASADPERIADEIAALTLADLTRVARLDLDRAHLVLELRGRRAPVEAGFRALAVSPEWMVSPAREEPVSAPEPRPSRPVADAGTEGPLPPPIVITPDREHPGATPAIRQGDVALSVDDFLRITGHAGDISHRRQMLALRIGLIAGGAAGVATGGVMRLTAEDCSSYPIPSNAREACEGRRHRQVLRAYSLLVAGGALAVVGLQVHARRPPLYVLQEYADGYNLRRTRRAAPSSPGAVTVSPAAGGGVLGVVVEGRF